MMPCARPACKTDDETGKMLLGRSYKSLREWEWKWVRNAKNAICKAAEDSKQKEEGKEGKKQLKSKVVGKLAKEMEGKRWKRGRQTSIGEERTPSVDIDVLCQFRNSKRGSRSSQRNFFLIFFYYQFLFLRSFPLLWRICRTIVHQ